MAYIPKAEHAPSESMAPKTTDAIDALEYEWFEHQPTLLLPTVDQLPTMPMPLISLDRRSVHGPKPIRLEAIGEDQASQRNGILDDELIDQFVTLILPAVGLKTFGERSTHAQGFIASRVSSQVELLRNLAKSSGIYAVATLVSPLISLVLAPFLTHALSVSDYGLLALLNTIISLGAGVTQLGLGSALFRAYAFDYTSPRDRRGVVATTILLLAFVSILMTIVTVLGASWLAGLLVGRQTLGVLIILAAGVVLLQNMSVPAFAWLRAANRPLPFLLLSLANLLVNLIATIVLVGILHTGVAGVLLATGCGSALVVFCTIPFLLGRFGLYLRLDIARSMLAFGSPMILNFIAYWMLQLSDRYLLNILGSLAQTASYSVAYSLGLVLSIMVVTPFTLAWPTAMYAIAKRKDAPQMFRLVFRWFSALLLFFAFIFSLAARELLHLFFPPSYADAAPVTPFIAQASALYGIYFVFMVGANIKRKTWLAAVFMGVAAFVNIALNLVFIPAYGAIGAAFSTLIAFIVLVGMAYIINQIIYPIPFEIGRFFLAFFLGAALYLGAASLGKSGGEIWAWLINVASLIMYGVLLVLLVGGLDSLRWCIFIFPAKALGALRRRIH